ncbi:MAG: hypothetical protein HQK77_21265, partial [Desulfobacterales bacterium]|nr:hypothetical protein [Desulfobacterales bacterium]
HVTLIGEDLSHVKTQSLAFAKVMLFLVDGFDETNAYDRYRSMDLLRFELSLKGYMMRAVSQFMREWSRVSHEAISNGFNFRIMSNAIRKQYQSLPYIRGMELLLVTSSKTDVVELKSIGHAAMQYIQAMRKMTEELDFDCETCQYQKICNDASDMRVMREKLMKTREQ